MPFAQLGPIRLHYHEFGHGPQSVVFVHGFQASARIWQLMAEQMPADQYRCIAVDNRGAAQSDAPADESAYGCKPFADDLHLLIESLGLRQVVLVGHSMGGATAMQYAVDHPERLTGLVLMDPADPDGRAPDPAGVDAALDRMMAARRPTGTPAELMSAGTNVNLPPGFAEALGAEIAAAPPQRLRGSMRSMFTLSIGDQVGRLPMPVLMMAGDNDQTISLARMLQTFAKLPPGSGLHVWHGVGHSPNIETPERAAHVLRRFIEKTIPSRTAARA